MSGMKLVLYSFLLLLFSAFPFDVVSAAEHRANLEDLADRLSRGITEAELRSVAVADFLTPDGKPSDLGWYLANPLSDRLLQQHEPFRVLSRGDIEDTRLSATDLSVDGMLQRVGSVWGVDAIITGTVDNLPDHYLISASVRRVLDGAIITTASQPIHHSRILDLLRQQGLDTGGAPPLQSGVNGISAPTCISCALPSPSARARKTGLQPTVVLSVVVSADGCVARIAIVKGTYYGLTDKAIEDVSEWKFKPALDKDGRAVPVVVPIEVTFG
jgi:TonB family protein